MSCHPLTQCDVRYTHWTDRILKIAHSHSLIDSHSSHPSHDAPVHTKYCQSTDSWQPSSPFDIEPRSEYIHRKKEGETLLCIRQESRVHRECWILIYSIWNRCTRNTLRLSAAVSYETWHNIREYQIPYQDEWKLPLKYPFPSLYMSHIPNFQLHNLLVHLSMRRHFPSHHNIH